MFEKEKASFLNCGSTIYAESSRPSCLLYNRNFVTKSWNFSYICWDAKWYRFGENTAKVARIAKVARMAKMAKMAIMAKISKIVTIATFAKMTKEIEKATNARIA